MSLNGLDDPQVVEAFEAGGTEQGAWFFLKYETRDVVVLLGRGTGGVAEARDAVSAYQEPTPLYGFMKYRRRTVIIKYLPQDCSRLFKARVAVHFNAVCDRFSPYDSVFEMSKADQLKDSKLSAACSLHMLSRSNSTTSSLRKKRMSEIAEEEEEEQQRAQKRHSALGDGGQPATKRQSLNKDKGSGGRAQSPPADPVKLNSGLATSPENSKFSAADTAQLPNFTGATDHRPTSSSAKTIDIGRRLSSQTARPDLFTYSTYTYGKPKVKLGPRPSLDVGGRPHTAGNFRPVSQIPAGFKLFGKGAKKGSGKDKGGPSLHRDGLGADSLASDASKLAIPEQPHVELARPSTSSGVVTAGAAMSGPGPSTPAKPAISREKARLMKAKRLREQKKQKNAETIQTEAVSPAGGTTSTEAEETSLEKVDEPDANSLSIVRSEAGNTQPEKRLSIVKADSAVAIETLFSSVHTDQGSEITQSDSGPTSPINASSEPNESTKASSLSGSTDETVRGKDGDEVEDKVEPDETASDCQPNAQSVGAVEIEDTQLVAIAMCRVSQGSEDAAARSPVQTKWQPEQPGELGVDEVHEANAAEDAQEDAHGAEQVLPASDKAELIRQLSNDGATEAEEGRDENFERPPSAASKGMPTAAAASSSGPDSETDGIPEGTLSDAATTTDNGPRVPDQPIGFLESRFSSRRDSRATAGAVATVPRLMPEADTVENVASTKETATHEARDEKSESTSEHAKPKRKAFIESIKTDLAGHSRRTSRSENNLEDDESLMEELQSATLEEAKPMLVAKTPVTAGFPISHTGDRQAAMSGGTPYVVRTVSNPMRGSSMAVTGDVSLSSARSLSSGAAYLHKITQQQQQMGDKLSTKANVGSRISQRIKALEMLSAPLAEAGAQNGARERPSSRFFSVNSGRQNSRSPSVVERASSFRKQTPPSAVDSRDASPDAAAPRRRERSGSVASRLSMFESPPGAGTSGPSPGNVTPRATSRGRPETISVTARIVHDGGDAGPQSQGSRPVPLGLKQSLLLVDHQKATGHGTDCGVAQETWARSRESDAAEAKASRGRRSSLRVVKNFIREGRMALSSSPPSDVVPSPSQSPIKPPSSHQNNSIAWRLSLSRDRDGLTSPSTFSDGSSGDDSKSFSSDKKRSRTSRLMHRLSSLSGGVPRGKASPPTPALSPASVAEEAFPNPEPRPATTPAPSTIITCLGDVNVQFPDTLLWKRRNMSLDSQGFLILSPASQVAARPVVAHVQGTKRYHLSEFRAPYMPDVEVEELPNSVVLDLLEGSAVQVACEDRAGQMHTLQVLQQAHRNTVEHLI